MEEDSKLTQYILIPSLSGVYVSKADLQIVAAMCGYTLQTQERKRMLKELFALARGVDDFCKIIDAFMGFFEYKKDLYKNITKEYPSTTSMVETLTQKTKEAVREFKKSKEEAALIA